jgi:hypothetical protein
MLHSEGNGQKQEYRKNEIKRIVFVTPTKSEDDDNA